MGAHIIYPAAHGGGGHAISHYPHKKEPTTTVERQKRLLGHESGVVVSDTEHGSKPSERRYVPLAWQLCRLNLLAVRFWADRLRYGWAG